MDLGKPTETVEVKSKMETGRLNDLFAISFIGEPHSSLVKLNIIEATALAIDLIQYIKEMDSPEEVMQNEAPNTRATSCLEESIRPRPHGSV
jgi:hypothetical protein